MICKKCVMDTTDPRIKFNHEGVCNHCLEYDYVYSVKLPPLEVRERQFQAIVQDIKSSSTSEYDCVIGLSGGVDSSYLAYTLVKDYGLNPLAIHLDNGWNSREAVKNIRNITKRLNIDLHTHVIEWEEFKDLQRAYFSAHVIDLEVPTDHAIQASLYKYAMEYNIKHVLLGTNRATEQILPLVWKFNKNDLINITDIHGRFGSVELTSYPTLGAKKLKDNLSSGMTIVAPLNHMKYVKDDAKQTLIDELSWKDYGGKHFESVFTRFYQGYILPKKFNVDKRKAHLASLINSGQMTRSEGLEVLKSSPYGEDQINTDKEFFLKKLDFTLQWFEEYLSAPGVSHFKYKTNFHSKMVYFVYPQAYELSKFLKKLRPAHRHSVRQRV